MPTVAEKWIEQGRMEGRYGRHGPGCPGKGHGSSDREIWAR